MGGDADLVLVGDVYTCDAVRSWAGAVAVRGDRIVAVGSERDVREAAGSAGEVVRAPCIVPGFQDSHIHAPFAGRNLLNVNLDDVHDAEGYLARIRSFAEQHTELPWIVGGGWYNPVFDVTNGPRKEVLDTVVADRPVFLMNSDTHAAWVNSRALETGGITTATPDPVDGYYVRDADGTPTGCLQEGASYSFWSNVVPRPSTDDWMAALRRAQTELLALGVTGWQDAWVQEDVLRAYRELDDAGELVARVVTSLWWDRHRGPEQIDDLIERRRWGSGGNVDANTVKIMLDGCPESCTSAMLEPYEGAFGAEHGTGMQFVEDEALADAVVRLDAAGFQVHQHALGDRAIRSALDAVAAAREANGMNDARHHLAHIQLPDPADVPRLRPLGVVANLQPLWAAPDPMIEGMTRPRVGKRAEHLYPIADVVRTGAVLSFGSDWPVSSPNPWLEMEVAVTRQVPGSPDAGVLDESQRIDLHTAIAAFAGGSAYVNHDDDAGSIEVGKRADLVCLDRNPFEGPPTDIGRTAATITIAAGRIVHGAETSA